jgi:hypothetical protein
MVRLLRVLPAAVLALALGACGSSPGSNSAAPSGNDTAPGVTAGPRPAPPWKSACDVLTKADVQAATSGHKAVITVADGVETDKGGIEGFRHSLCEYDLTSVEKLPDGSTVANDDNSLCAQLRIDEDGADSMFPPQHSETTVDGLGDSAYWASDGAAALFVRLGDELYDFDISVPPDHDTEDVGALDRDASLRMAKAVFARLR